MNEFTDGIEMEVDTSINVIGGGVMYVVNIILGSLNALFSKEFDWKKHLYGVAKAFVACLSILFFCTLLNLFSYGLSLVDIHIGDNVITILQVIGVLVG